MGSPKLIKALSEQEHLLEDALAVIFNDQVATVADKTRYASMNTLRKRILHWENLDTLFTAASDDLLGIEDNSETDQNNRGKKIRVSQIAVYAYKKLHDMWTRNDATDPIEIRSNAADVQGNNNYRVHVDTGTPANSWWLGFNPTATDNDNRLRVTRQLLARHAQYNYPVMWRYLDASDNELSWGFAKVLSAGEMLNNLAAYHIEGLIPTRDTPSDSIVTGHKLAFRRHPALQALVEAKEQFIGHWNVITSGSVSSGQVKRVISGSEATLQFHHIPDDSGVVTRAQQLEALGGLDDPAVVYIQKDGDNRFGFRVREANRVSATEVHVSYVDNDTSRSGEWSFGSGDRLWVGWHAGGDRSQRREVSLMNSARRLDPDISRHSDDWYPYFGGRADITINSSGNATPTRGFHRVRTNGSATDDDLDTMDVTHIRAGGMVRLQAYSNSEKVTVRHLQSGTHNFHLAGGVDCPLDDTSKSLTVIRDGDIWREVTRVPIDVGKRLYVAKADSLHQGGASVNWTWGHVTGGSFYTTISSAQLFTLKDINANQLSWMDFELVKISTGAVVGHFRAPYMGVGYSGAYNRPQFTIDDGGTNRTIHIDITSVTNSNDYWMRFKVFWGSNPVTGFQMRAYVVRGL